MAACLELCRRMGPNRGNVSWKRVSFAVSPSARPASWTARPSVVCFEDAADSDFVERPDSTRCRQVDHPFTDLILYFGRAFQGTGFGRLF